MNVTDRQTDGGAIAYSERESEFTFANNWFSRSQTKIISITITEIQLKLMVSN